MEPPPPTTAPTPLGAPMRWTLFAACALATGIGLPLLLFPDYTDKYFPWRVAPPLNAAFLGANYVAAGVLEFFVARQRRWQSARITVPGVFVFTVVTAVLTWLHVDRLDLSRPPVLAWVATYTITPFVLIWAWVRQRRNPPSSPPPVGKPSQTVSTPRSVRIVLATFASLSLALGLYLELGLNAAVDLWPWPMDQASEYLGAAGMAPYFGAWLLGLGVVAARAAPHYDVRHLQPIFVSALALLALQSIVLLLHGEIVRWSSIGAAVHLSLAALLATVSILGLHTCDRVTKAPS